MQEICPVCGSKELKNIDTNRYKCLACDEVFNLQGVSAQELIAKDIYNQNIDSIVEVSCVFGDEDSSGTGFCALDGGYIITNAHVVIDINGKNSKLCESVYVCKNRSTEYFDAEIVYLDAKNDLALLHVQANQEFKPVKLAKKIEIGEKLTVIGNSEGKGLMVFDGIVGDLDREYKNTSAFVFNSLVTHGCSGGPIFNSRGELCGVTVGGSKTNTGINYGIPVDILESFIQTATKEKCG